MSVFTATMAETGPQSVSDPVLRVPRVSRQRSLPPRRLQLFNDISRQSMAVDEAHCGMTISDEVIPFTGKGVVIGIIDCGIDPRHPAFFDPKTGDSRVGLYVTTSSAAENNSGSLQYVACQPMTDGLPEAFGIDESADGHGTHTSATAGGSDTGVPYYGMAPDATFVMTSVGEYIYEDEVEFGITNALDYARDHDMPCVASLSLGSCAGMHDGSGTMTDLLADELDSSGAIVCFAAGNDGLNRVSLYRDFDSDPGPLKTAFGLGNWGGTISGVSCFFVTEQEDIQIAFSLIRTAPGKAEEVAVSPFYSLNDIPVGGIDLTSAVPGFDLHTDPEQSYIGLQRRAGYGRNIGIEIYASTIWLQEDNSYTLGVIIDSPGGGMVRGYADFSSLFCSYGLTGYMQGSAAQSISDYCASPYVISVGGTVERSCYTDIDGRQVFSDTDSFGQIHSTGITSSYGTIPEKLPHTMGSSIDVISAIPAYSNLPKVTSVTYNDDTWYYAANSGTSMATPAVAGVIALWLQADPSLTRQDILDILEFTHTDNYATERSQFGIPDAYKGLKYIIEKSSVDKIFYPGYQSRNPTQLMIKYLDNNTIECVIPFPTEGGSYALYSIDGHLLVTDTFVSPTFTLSLPGYNGIAILKATTPQGCATQKIMLP